MDMRDILNEQMKKFNDRIETDTKLKQEMEGIERTIQIEITDGSTYYTSLKNNHANDLQEGSIENPDIVISSDEATIKGLLNKEISPIKAFLVTKQLKIKASLEDKLRLRKFFQ
jgi:putative sterol carrier protein